QLVLAKINTALLLEFFNKKTNNSLIDVTSAHMSVTISRLYFNHIVSHLKDGNVKGAASEVIHHDLLILLFIETIRKRCCGRFIDDASHLKAGDLSCVLRRF